MSYSTEPTPTYEPPSSHDSECAHEPSMEGNTSPPAQSGTEGTSIDVVASAQDAGLTADVSVVNLDALGVLNDGIDADVTTNLLSGDAGDSDIEIALSADVGGISFDPIGGCGPLDLGDTVASLTDLSSLDVCSLADHVGI